MDWRSNSGRPDNRLPGGGYQPRGYVEPPTVAPPTPAPIAQDELKQLKAEVKQLKAEMEQARSATPEMKRQIHQAISDPGSFVPRGRKNRDGETIHETVTHWGMRAVLAAVFDPLANDENDW